MFESIEDIRAAVEERKGVLSLTMKELLQASATGGVRCTPGNIRKIRHELDEQELEYYPPGLDTNQDTIIRIYDPCSPCCEIIYAVLNPGEWYDDIIRCSSLLQQVKEILCA